MDVDPIDFLLIILILVVIVIVIGMMTDWSITHNPLRGFCLTLFKNAAPSDFLANILCGPYVGPVESPS